MMEVDHPGSERENTKVSDKTSWKTILSDRRVFINTFGCAYNEGDSSKLSTYLMIHGSEIVSDPDDADTIIINSCIVIDSTERKMVKEIKKYSGKDVWITGCLPLARKEILTQFPTVRVIDPDSVPDNPEIIPQNENNRIRVVQVGPGCAGSCSYCITRFARGRIRSKPVKGIVKSIQNACTDGSYEIRLTGQDLSAYGYDTERDCLSGLLAEISKVTGDFRIRLGMMNPSTLLPIASEVAETMANGPFFNFLHLPVQSGSDDILKKMNRGYTTGDVIRILEIFRRYMPEITIATDFITGYPGERESDNMASLDLMKRMLPGMVNVTRYSYRPGSTINRDDELPERIRKERSRKMIAEAYSYLLKKNEMKVGEIREVLTTEILRPGSVMARTNSYEGVVIHGEIKLGRWYRVKISGCSPHYMTGIIVS